MAYYELEPWGEIRDDYRAALIAQTIHNSACWDPAHRLPLREFLLIRPDEPKQPTDPKESARQAAAQARRWVRRVGGQVG